jgi:hypothetical protein
MHREDASFDNRVRAVDWSQYSTAYDRADAKHAFRAGRQICEQWGSVADQLIRLRSADASDALEASLHLWCGLCHQDAYVSSAALPALPFILEVLDHADETLATDILDTLLGFARCSRSASEPWIGALNDRLKAELARFERLAVHANHEIAESARYVVEALTATPQEWERLESERNAKIAEILNKAKHSDNSTKALRWLTRAMQFVRGGR